MTGRGMSLMAMVRRALAALPGSASVRMVRDRRQESLPLGQMAAHLVQPLDSREVSWPQSSGWRYEVNRFALATVGRGRPGTASQEQVASLHGAALAALTSDAGLLAVLSDGPALSGAEWSGSIGPVRVGRTAMDDGRAGDPLTVVTEVVLCSLIESPTESITLDGAPLFESGPSELMAEGPRRLSADRLFNGLRGGGVVDVGARARRLVQQGRLMAASETALAQLEAAIEAMAAGDVHELVDRDGTTYPYVRLERFERTGPVESGRAWHRPYRIEYTQLLREG